MKFSNLPNPVHCPTAKDPVELGQACSIQLHDIGARGVDKDDPIMVRGQRRKHAGVLQVGQPFGFSTLNGRLIPVRGDIMSRSNADPQEALQASGGRSWRGLPGPCWPNRNLDASLGRFCLKLIKC